MPAITPFSLDPGQDFFSQRLTLYWYATCLDLAYSTVTPATEGIYALGGGAQVQSLDPPGLLWPGVTISTYSASRGLVVCRGTETLAQMIGQILGVPLLSIAPFPGQVGVFWATATAVIWSLVRPIFEAAGVFNLAWAGHSLGGAIAQLAPDLALDSNGTVNSGVVTLGSPRCGSIAWASAQSYRAWRLTNAGDPVPALPPSANPTLDNFFWLLAPAPVNAFFHAGARAHLFSDGTAAFPADESTWATAQDALVNLALGSTDWYIDHSVSEYARRLRSQIPVAMGAGSPDWPGLLQLDQYWLAASITPPAATWLDLFLCSEP